MIFTPDIFNLHTTQYASELDFACCWRTGVSSLIFCLPLPSQIDKHQGWGLHGLSCRPLAPRHIAVSSSTVLGACQNAFSANSDPSPSHKVCTKPHRSTALLATWHPTLYLFPPSRCFPCAALFNLLHHIPGPLPSLVCGHGCQYAAYGGGEYDGPARAKAWCPTSAIRLPEYTVQYASIWQCQLASRHHNP